MNDGMDLFHIILNSLSAKTPPPSPLELSSDLCSVIRGFGDFVLTGASGELGGDTVHRARQQKTLIVDAVMLCHSDSRAVTVKGTSRNFTIKNLLRCYAKSNLNVDVKLGCMIINHIKIKSDRQFG